MKYVFSFPVQYVSEDPASPVSGTVIAEIEINANSLTQARDKFAKALGKGGSNDHEVTLKNIVVPP